ncbi:MAG TPA: hypothetical protein VMV60_06475 [Thermoanaerobaculia bacterium]|nr:hypothetical protein [Thermoanaerobaculia bacterium]
MSRLFRVLVLAALAPLLVGGAFGHVESFEVLSHGTFFFPPDHPAHAPFVPAEDHACAACAVANVLPPAAAPVFRIQPQIRLALAVRVERVAPSPALPELPGRSPPPDTT